MQRLDEVDEVRRKLLAQAFLYDHPEAYASGVEAALRAVRELPANVRRDPPSRSAS